MDPKRVKDFARRGLALLPNDENEVEAFYMHLENFREDHTFFKIIVGDFDAKIGSGRTSEERHIGAPGLEWIE
ncbi:hypothetical protein KIN20_018973 [Parelaphostrongylus tenuis]|uniref:Uncharacterized protein n=1 Tax=Parelaphostrongylus tenuis TaxID=148309 RepID=A0AAD5QUS3_PARTN|nr:hypothetical protein KIN20_018973 [Parelaphostrongylus tenuis]